MKKEITTAVVLAAGQGRRMNTQIQKQYLLLAGKPVLYYSLKAFEKSNITRVILVTGEEEIEYCRREIVEKFGFRKVERIVAGGMERYHSVYEGLKAAKGSDYVLIHDGARPFLTEEIIERTLTGAREYGACIAGMPVKDTIKIVDEDGMVIKTPKRSSLWQIQTPQTFSYPLIYHAYQELLEQEKQGAGITVTDDAMVLEASCAFRETGHRQVKLVEGAYENIKITTPSDLLIAEQLVNQQ